MKHLHVLALPCLMAALLLSGCSQKGADAYVGEQITSLKGKDTDTYSDFLQSGIDKLYNLCHHNTEQQPCNRISGIAKIRQYTINVAFA